MAQKWPNLVQNLHFWSFWAKYCHFLHILSNDRPKTMCTRCLGEFSVMWVTKLMISQVKKKDFLTFPFEISISQAVRFLRAISSRAGAGYHSIGTKCSLAPLKYTYCAYIVVRKHISNSLHSCHQLSMVKILRAIFKLTLLQRSLKRAQNNFWNEMAFKL